jgi:hypothetical protein
VNGSILRKEQSLETVCKLFDIMIAGPMLDASELLKKLECYGNFIPGACLSDQVSAKAPSWIPALNKTGLPHYSAGVLPSIFLSTSPWTISSFETR